MSRTAHRTTPRTMSQSVSRTMLLVTVVVAVTVVAAVVVGPLGARLVLGLMLLLAGVALGWLSRSLQGGSPQRTSALEVQPN